MFNITTANQDNCDYKLATQQRTLMFIRTSFSNTLEADIRIATNSHHFLCKKVHLIDKRFDKTCW